MSLDVALFNADLGATKENSGLVARGGSEVTAQASEEALLISTDNGATSGSTKERQKKLLHKTHPSRTMGLSRANVPASLTATLSFLKEVEALYETPLAFEVAVRPIFVPLVPTSLRVAV